MDAIFIRERKLSNAYLDRRRIFYARFTAAGIGTPDSSS
jgi:hypothetical protein